MSPLIVIASLLLASAVFLFVFWIGPVWDRVAQRYIADLAPRLSALGIDDALVGQYLRWWGGTLVAVFVTFTVFGMLPIAIGLTLLVFVLPRYILDSRIHHRRILLRDQIARATVAFANAARAGLSLPQCVEMVANETPRPLGIELRRIARDHASGRTLVDAIGDVQRRLDLEAFDLFALAIAVCLERGGRVTVALEKISDGLRELQRLERKLEADTAAGRRVAFILASFPLIFLVGFTMMDPVSMGYLYTTTLGQFVLLGVGVIVYFAVVWCFRILDLNF